MEQIDSLFSRLFMALQICFFIAMYARGITPGFSGPAPVLESEDMVARHASWSQSATSTGLSQRICVPLQPAFLSNDRIQLYLGNCGTCLGTYLRDTLQRRVGSPDSMIGNKPDRQGLIRCSNRRIIAN